MATTPFLPNQLLPATSDPTFKASVGTQAKSPTSNITTTPTVLPKAQAAPKDLSGTYARTADGTIYNKQAQTKFSNPADFFKDSGVGSFDNLKFDTAYSPTGKESIYGQVIPTQVSNPAPTSSNPPTPTPAPTLATPTPTGPYTPPNQGTNGVSQGGIIGNLINTANNQSPEVQKRIDDIKKLQESEAQSEANIDSEPIDLSLASGQKGILSRLFAAKSGAAQTALQNALTEQGQSIQATSSAGSLNAPIVTQPGAAVLNPSSNSTVGGTSSGASNLSTLIGQGNGSNGHPQGEFFNTQTGQGFSSPQQLADFVNQQVPNAGATPQNVFDLLKSGALNGGGGNIVGVNSGTIDSYVSMVLSGQANQIPSSVTGNIALWNQVLQKAQQQNPNLNLNQINASVSANTSIYGNSLGQVQELNTALNNVKQLGSMTVQNAQGANVNPFALVPGNQAISSIRSLLSDTGQATFNSNMAQLQAAIQNLYSKGGGNTPTNITSAIGQLADGSISVDGLKALLGAAESEGQILLNNAQAQASSSYSNINANNVGAGSGTNNPQGWF